MGTIFPPIRTMTVNSVEWRCEEPGYWLSERGAVVHERDGWWWYPDDEHEHPPGTKLGPYRTMAKAMEAVTDG